MKNDFSKWVVSVDGKHIDRDGFPPEWPWQCHDVFLDYANRVGGMSISNPNLGWAPGDGYTDKVYTKFPAVKGIERYFKKVAVKNIQRGDVVFYTSYNGGLPHVVVATGAAIGGSFTAVSQNVGNTKHDRRTKLIHAPVRGVIGALRPLFAIGTSPGKTVKQLAAEVWEGKWGTGATRVKRLKAAGYDPVAVQREVDKGRPQPTSTYTVKRGDTLSEIGERVGVRWQSLASMNGIRAPYTIHAGQKLRLK